MAWTLSIRRTLDGLIVASVAPFLVFGSLMMVQTAGEQQATIERNLRRSTSDITTALDQALFGLKSPLLALAESDALQQDNLTAFNLEARAVSARQGWTMVLTDASGRELINTRLPLGTVLPATAQPADLLRAAASGQPAISDLIFGSSTGHPAIAIVVPVKRRGRPIQFLIANVIGTVRDIVARAPPSGGIAVLLDRQGRIVARAPELAGVVGQMAAPESLTQTRRTDVDSFTTVTRDGIPVYNSVSHMEDSGWTVIMGVPQSTLFAPLRRSEMAIAGAGTALLALALAVAVLLGRHVRRNVMRLSAAAAALGRGEAVAPPPPTHIGEVDAVGRALAEAAATIARRTGQLETALAALGTETEKSAEVERQLAHAQKIEALGQLTGGISHDFNNILGGIIGYLELVADRVAGSPEATDLVDAATITALRGADLTKRLLALARRQPLAPRVIDVNLLVAGITDLLRRTLGEEIAIVVSQAECLWPATADPGRLEDALLNLAINARDAMAEGGRLTIETDNAVLDESYAAVTPGVTAGAYVMLAVSDTGSGMSEEVLQRACEPFFTTKEVGKGSGLGLSMVYGFASQSGGHLKLSSSPGRGTSVRLYLPRGDTVTTAPGGGLHGPPALRGAETVLLVDANETFRDATARNLAELGYRVSSAGDAATALALFAAGSIDILLTDLALPGGTSGRQLAAELRRQRADLPVLFVSSVPDRPEAGFSADGTGTTRLIAKPFLRRDLAAWLRAMLDNVPAGGPMATARS